MKHYLSTAMIKKKVDRLCKEISSYELQYLKAGNAPKRKTHIAKLRQELHRLRLLLIDRANQTTIKLLSKNGRN